MKYDSCRISLKEILQDFQNTLLEFFFLNGNYYFPMGYSFLKVNSSPAMWKTLETNVVISIDNGLSLGTLYIMDFYKTGVCFTKELLTILKLFQSL